MTSLQKALSSVSLEPLEIALEAKDQLNNAEPDFYEFRLDRMLEYLWVWEDPWGVGFCSEEIGKGDSQESKPFSGSTLFPQPAWHAGRIRYLMANPEVFEFPIEVDCECSGGHVLPMPVILDGWHRYFGHLWLGRDTIRATFGGLVDVREYLQGLIDVRPE